MEALCKVYSEQNILSEFLVQCSGGNSVFFRHMWEIEEDAIPEVKSIKVKWLRSGVNIMVQIILCYTPLRRPKLCITLLFQSDLTLDSYFYLILKWMVGNRQHTYKNNTKMALPYHLWLCPTTVFKENILLFA